MQLFLQLLVNGISLGAIYALVALGFSIIFAVAKTFHFVHGSVYMISAYCFYTLRVVLAWNLYISILTTLVIATLIGISVEIHVYRRMRRWGATPLTIFIAAFGWLIVIQNIVAIFYGNDAKNLRPGLLVKSIDLGGVIITYLQVETFLFAIVLFIAVLLFLRFSKIGRNMRAVSSSPEMARIIGIDVDQVYWVTYGVGSALAVPAAILISYQFQATPDMGTWAVLMAVISLIVGGIGSIPGAALAGMILGVATNVGIWKIPSEWQSAIAFGILIVFIVLKPTGIFGTKLETGEV